MILERFERGGLTAPMTTPPRVVKLGISQERQFPRMRSQAHDVEDVIKISVEEKKRAKPINEDKKVEQRNDEKKSPISKKLKVRKRRPTRMAVHVEFPRRSHGKKKGPRNRHPRRRKTKGKRKGTKVLRMEFKAYIVGTKGSRLNEIFEKAGRYIFSL